MIKRLAIVAFPSTGGCLRQRGDGCTGANSDAQTCSYSHANSGTNGNGQAQSHADPHARAHSNADSC